MKKANIGVLIVLALIGVLTNCTSVAETTNRPNETRPFRVYDTVFEATREINSKSFALLSLAQYNDYNKLPDYLKAVYDASEVYVSSFQIVNTFAVCWSDGRIEYTNSAVGSCPDEKTIIEKTTAYLNSQKTRGNAESIENIIERLSLGLAQNIVIAVTDYLNFVVAVSNAEENYYDSNTQSRLSIDERGNIRIITREEQLNFMDAYNSVKSNDYKTAINALLRCSQRLLNTLNSNLLLPIKLN